MMDHKMGTFTQTTALLLLLAAFALSRPCRAQRSDPSQFNGGSVLAMAGRNSVAIAIDARFGLGMQTVSIGEDDDDHRRGGDDGDDRAIISGEGNPRMLMLPNSDALMAWTGLYGDGMGFAEEVSALLARKVRRAGCMGFPAPDSAARRRMSPRAITMLVSHLLYRRRNAPYYVEPVVVGLERARVPVIEGESVDDLCIEDSSKELASMTQGAGTLQLVHNMQKEQQPTTRRQATTYRTILRPYLCGTDMLGAQSRSDSFVCSGVASRSLHGTAEALWRPGLEGEELVEVCGRAFVSALERDILSGYGAVVYLIRATAGDDVEIIEYVLACRND